MYRCKTAKLLGFYGHGVTRVKVEYVGRAPLQGSDDRKLIATLREGVPATPPVQVASTKPFAPAYFDSRPLTNFSVRTVPSPPDRPYRLGEGARDVPAVAAPTTELAAAARPRPRGQSCARLPSRLSPKPLRRRFRPMCRRAIMAGAGFMERTRPLLSRILPRHVPGLRRNRLMRYR